MPGKYQQAKISCDICGKVVLEFDIKVLNDETICPECYKQEMENSENATV